ncbi:MAG: 2-oxo acid dehydrogenase subunit E2 [Alicyclobacillus sp.]|nr:2-oxo acid dehydrogenase subunit E2 [Alicyclobacillus sp.]
MFDRLGNEGPLLTDPYGDIPIKSTFRLSGARKVIARRLGEGWRNSVPVTLHRRLDVQSIERLRTRNSTGAKDLSFIDYVLFALVRALHTSDIMNATFDGETVRIYSTVNLGIAVDSPRGLAVPVLHNAHALSILELRQQRRRLIELVRQWKQRPSDLTGGTFTVSNLGSFGVEYFTPIINPPQVAILGLGQAYRQTHKAVGSTEELRHSATLPVSLTFDHQVMDGALAAEFLIRFQEQIEEIPSLFGITD